MLRTWLCASMQSKEEQTTTHSVPLEGKKLPLLGPASPGSEGEREVSQPFPWQHLSVRGTTTSFLGTSHLTLCLQTSRGRDANTELEEIVLREEAVGKVGRG